MEERQAGVDSFTLAYASWFPQPYNVGRIDAFVYNPLWGTGSPRGVEDIVRGGTGTWVYGRPTAAGFEPLLSCYDIASGGGSVDNHETHAGNTIPGAHEMFY